MTINYDNMTMPQGILVCSPPPIFSLLIWLLYIYLTITNYYVDPLSSYPTLEQLSQLEYNQWFQLGIRLGLGKDQLEAIKKSQHPTAATLQAAKIKNIDMLWKDIVEALLSIGEYELAESVCTQQGQLLNNS